MPTWYDREGPLALRLGRDPRVVLVRLTRGDRTAFVEAKLRWEVMGRRRLAERLRLAETSASWL